MTFKGQREEVIQVLHRHDRHVLAHIGGAPTLVYHCPGVVSGRFDLGLQLPQPRADGGTLRGALAVLGFDGERDPFGQADVTLVGAALLRATVRPRPAMSLQPVDDVGFVLGSKLLGWVGDG